MIGDIMLLIPGLMSTNAIRDVLIGDTLSGIIRLIAALLLAAALALWIYGGNLFYLGGLDFDCSNHDTINYRSHWLCRILEFFFHIKKEIFASGSSWRLP